MCNSMDDKLRAARALNLCTVSVAQIVDYNDINVLEQEYENILNNLNLEQMPKDEPLLDVLKKILDTITYFRMSEGDKKMIDAEYQHKVKNAIWSAIPSVGAIFATSNPIAMGVTLATQVGIGYMNYRRNKADYQLGKEKNYWQLRRGAIDQLNGLQKELFETAWRLSKEYEFPDEYRLTEKQIHEYNAILMEPNLVKRFNRLDAIRKQFIAYPQFWYQMGSTANSIFRSDEYATDPEIQGMFKTHAVECFEKYRELNQVNMLRCDVLTSSWALEYLELQDLNVQNNAAKARELIETAEKYSGKALDVLELCAFAYLRISDYDNAERLFRILVNENYNPSVNAQILSALYIEMMRSDDHTKAANARVYYNLLPSITDPKFILNMPDEQTELSQWKADWIRDETPEEQLKRLTTEKEQQQQQEKRQKEEAKKKARAFYQMPIKLVYKKGLEDVAEYFLGTLKQNISKIDPQLPSPSRCELKEYTKRREELECENVQVILLGDSSEAKTVYRANGKHWDYARFGMRYLTLGQKSVLMAQKLENKQIDAFIKYALEVNKKHRITVPTGIEDVESVKFSFLKDCFEGALDSPVDTAAHVLAAIIASPLLVIGQALEGIQNGIQGIQNISAGEKLEFLQYCILIYEFLNNKNALVD